MENLTESRQQIPVLYLYSVQRTDIFGKLSKSRHTFLFLYKGDFPTCLYLSENSLTTGVQRQKCTLHQFGNILVSINKTSSALWLKYCKKELILVRGLWGFFVLCSSSVDQQEGLVLCAPMVGFKNSPHVRGFLTVWTMSQAESVK